VAGWLGGWLDGWLGGWEIHIRGYIFIFFFTL
jgi:hypothetical protein